MWRGALIAATLLVACTARGQAAERDVLVLVEDASVRSTHSIFLDDLRQQGWKVSIRSAEDKTLRLRDWDDWLYSKIAIFASSIPEFGGSVDSESLLEFVDQGGDLLLAVDAKASDELRGLVADLGVDLEKGHQAIDYQSSVELRGDQDRTLVASSSYGAAGALFGGSPPEGPVLYRGAGLSVPPESSQVFAALRGTPSTVAASVAATSPDTLLAGDDVVLVALMQARNNARVAISGSMELFSNRFFQAKVPLPGSSGDVPVANRAFASAVAQWAFSQRAVLRASPLRHSLAASSALSQGKYTKKPEGYRVSDEVDLALDLEELRDGRWQPYSAEDVQVEFVMLDPYVRISLLPSPQGNYTAHIKVPDVYGVFKFVVDYQRPGFSHISLSEQLPVRPFRHDEYERFLVAAYPYYASAASLMVAFLVLDFCLLYRK